jgi:hypothetical protein
MACEMRCCTTALQGGRLREGSPGACGSATAIRGFAEPVEIYEIDPEDALADSADLQPGRQMAIGAQVLR